MQHWRKRNVVAFGMVAALAFVCAANVGGLRAWADGGMTPDLTVRTDFPHVAEGGTVSFQLFTKHGAVPANLPIAVLSNVAAAAVTYPGYAPIITAVKAVLGGTLSVPQKQITGELQSANATRFTLGGANEYFSVLNAANMNFQPPVRAAQSLLAEEMVRTVVIAQEYYGPVRTVTGIDEFSAFDLRITVRDVAGIDRDSNLIPDATSLATEPLPIILLGDNGIVTIVTDLSPIARGTLPCGVEPATFITPNGPVTVEVTAPCLTDLKAQDSSLNLFNTARLVLTISPTDPQSTLDGPSGVDPLSEFALSPLPAPKNLWIRTNILLANYSGTGTPAWTSLAQLPGALNVIVDVSGPGMSLTPGTQVAGYTYAVTMTQSGENLTVTGDKHGWVETSVSLFPFEARATTVSAGDNLVEFSSRAASAIYATSAAPSTATSSGSSDRHGLCFIATAAYGTPMAIQIDSLRAVRDGYLISNPLGAAFVDSYYRLSPPLAREISGSDSMRYAVRLALAPVLALCGWLLASPGSFGAAAVGLGAASAVALRRIRSKKVR